MHARSLLLRPLPWTLSGRLAQMPAAELVLDVASGGGAGRDAEASDADAAASLAPNDGAEEAAFHLWLEQDRLSAARRKELRPDRYLRLAAELEFPPALAAMRGTKQ